MKKIILILLIFLGNYSAAQTNQTDQQAGLDSMLAVWKDPTQTDSVRTMAYVYYVWTGFSSTKPDTAMILANELLAYAEKNNYPFAEAKAYSLKGMTIYNQGLYSQAVEYNNQCIRILEKIGNKKDLANSLNNGGKIYHEQGNYPKALNCFTKSIKISEQLNDQAGIATSIGNIGVLYSEQGDYSQSISYVLKSLEIYKKLDHQLGIAFALNNIGILYGKQKEYTKAFNSLNESSKIFEILGDQINIANTLGSVGTIYQDKGDYANALIYQNKSLALYEKLGFPKGIIEATNAIGALYQIQGNHSKSLEYCKKGYIIALKNNYLDDQKDACQCLYESYKVLGNGNMAMKYNELLNTIEDSLKTKETIKKLQQMEFAKIMLQDSIAKAEEARLVQEAHEEEMRLEEKTKNISLGVGGLVLLLAGGLYSRLRYVRKSKAVLQVEKNRSENLLLNILPEEIAQELKIYGKAEARDFDLVSILFTDFKGFTEASAKMSAADLVNEITHCFEAFDGIMEKYGIEKIKTIGDAYMAAGGLPVPTHDSVKNTVLAALEMQSFIANRKAENDAANKPAFEMRVGIHTGPVVAGIVGVKKFQYDIWGDTVNTAARMESSGEVGKVNISQATYELLKSDPQFVFESRGKIEAKGKGEINMYFLTKK